MKGGVVIFFDFRKNIAPSVISLIFCVLVVASEAIGVMHLLYGLEVWNVKAIWFGLSYMILAPLFLRVIAEFSILVFKILISLQKRLAEQGNGSQTDASE